MAESGSEDATPTRGLGALAATRRDDLPSGHGDAGFDLGAVESNLSKKLFSITEAQMPPLPPE